MTRRIFIESNPSVKLSIPNILLRIVISQRGDNRNGVVKHRRMYSKNRFFAIISRTKLSSSYRLYRGRVASSRREKRRSRKPRHLDGVQPIEISPILLFPANAVRLSYSFLFPSRISGILLKDFSTYPFRPSPKPRSLPLLESCSLINYRSTTPFCTFYERSFVTNNLFPRSLFLREKYRSSFGYILSG